MIKTMHRFKFIINILKDWRLESGDCCVQVSLQMAEFTDLGFFSPAPVKEEEKDDEMEVVENKLAVNDLKAQKVKVNNNQIPMDFDLCNAREIFIKFLSNDLDFNNSQALDSRKYLESFLLPKMQDKNVDFHIIQSIVIMVNYQCLIGKKCLVDSRFSKIFSKSLLAYNDSNASLKNKSEIHTFLGNCFCNLDLAHVKSEAQRLVGIGTLCNIGDYTRQLYFKQIPELESVWDKTILNLKNIKKESTRERVESERNFMFNALKTVLKVMQVSLDEEILDDLLLFVETLLDLALKIIIQIPSRRFFNLILKDSLFFLRAKESVLVQRLEKQKKDKHIRLLQLLDLVEFYSYFEIDESTGLGFSKQEVIHLHYDKIKQLQKFCFQNLKDQAVDFALSNVGAVDNPDSLNRILSAVPISALVDMSNQLGVRTTDLDGHDVEKGFLIQSLIYFLKKREMERLEWMRNDVLYLDERIIFDESVSNLNMHPVALAPSSLRYLTLSDYLYRQYRLLKFEYADRLRKDILDAAQRLSPTGNKHSKNTNSVVFQGAARMAIPIEKVEIVEKGNTMIGHIAPSYVRAHIVFSLSNLEKNMAEEWDLLASDDILYLLSFNGSVSKQSNDDDLLTRVDQRFGLKHVRGCKIVGWVGSNGQILNEGIYNDSKIIDRSTGSLSSSRTLLVELDPHQYVLDQNKKKKKSSAADLYESLNVIMRRKANDNTWGHLLQPFREVVGFENLIPPWLKGGFLGHEDPSSSSYRNIPDLNLTFNFRDTFLDIDHIKESFPNMDIAMDNNAAEPPFVLNFPSKFWEFQRDLESQQENPKKRKINEGNDKSSGPTLEVKGAVATFHPYEGSNSKNSFKYSRFQIEGILSGMCPALTMIKTPAGTNGISVAAQIASNLYNNGQNHHLLVVSNTDYTLDRFLDSLTPLNIDERHILRLGHLTDKWNPKNQCWGRAGRVDSYLSKRISLLEKVSKLVRSLEIEQDYGATCELAGYFFESTISPLWKEFLSKNQSSSPSEIKDSFPFLEFFSDRSSPLFNEEMSFSDALHVAKGCYEYIRSIFIDLSELRPFEILRAGEDRADYLIMKGVRVVALTSAYASLHREKLLRLGFRFESLIILDAGQLLDSEVFFTFLLQGLHEETGLSRLERLIMVGDDSRLPPKVSSTALSRKCNLNQSLFSRLTRLGFPVIELEEQSEYRPTIANIFRSCYKELVDSPLISEIENFKYANPGFCFETQFINVDDYMGRGETEPRKQFIQNLGEAEYAVAIYMYMRLVGYPNNLISLLTSTHGQKELIKDIIKQRCGWNNFFGMPSVVATFDEYSDQKNAYVILSLVRTTNLGNLADGRRLLSAFSRATTGLYILGRKSIFEDSDVFQNSFKSLWTYPHNHLWINTEEVFEDKSRSVDNHHLKFVSKSSEWQVSKKEQDEVRGIGSVEEMGDLVHALSEKKLKD